MSQQHELCGASTYNEILAFSRLKDGPWNSMISAHPGGQIFADLLICPKAYCFMDKEVLPTVRVSGKTYTCYILSLLTHLQPEMSMKNGQIPPDSLTCALACLGVKLPSNSMWLVS